MCGKLFIWMTECSHIEQTCDTCIYGFHMTKIEIVTCRFLHCNFILSYLVCLIAESTSFFRERRNCFLRWANLRIHLHHGRLYDFVTTDMVQNAENSRTPMHRNNWLDLMRWRVQVMRFMVHLSSKLFFIHTNLLVSTLFMSYSLAYAILRVSKRTS